MLINREISIKLQQYAQQFPAVALMGPRQSGKTTLAKKTFPNYSYVTLEDLDMQFLARQDPRGFFATFANASGVIIDEIQEVPELLSYMQGIIDQGYKPGYFILTGSHNLLLHQAISQTLAGRIALLTLLPLTVQELQKATLLPNNIEATLLKGFYPRIYVQPIETQAWLSNYISTYIEKDVRQLINITDLTSFQRFLKLCAARVGNILNYADLARDADISPNTAKAWLSLLESSYIIKLLYPYYKNFNKRIVKSPKLYFVDTSLACLLLGIKTEADLSLHYMKGALFESFVISELFKFNYNKALNPNIYFWRDQQGHEIDCIIEKSIDSTVPIEIKAGKTIISEFFKELTDWQVITEQKINKSYLVYGGDIYMMQNKGTIIDWRSIYKMATEIYQ